MAINGHGGGRRIGKETGFYYSVVDDAGDNRNGFNVINGGSGRKSNSIVWIFPKDLEEEIYTRGVEKTHVSIYIEIQYLYLTKVSAFVIPDPKPKEAQPTFSYTSTLNWAIPAAGSATEE